MENATTNRYNSTSIFLITVGVVMMNIIIFGLVGRSLGRLFWSVDLQQLAASIKTGDYEITRANTYVMQLNQLLSQLGGFFLSTVIIIQILKRRFGEFTGLNQAPKLKWFGLALLIFICFMPIFEHVIAWNAGLQLPEKIDEYFTSQHEFNQKIYEMLLFYNEGPQLVLNLLLMALIPAICEELVFRGLVLRIFHSMWGNIHVAIAISSVLFAMIHVQIYNLVPMILLAMVFGYLYYLSGSLWVPIGLHFFNNASVVIAKNMGVSEDSMASTLPVALIMMGVGLILLIMMYKKSPKDKSLTLE